MKPLQSFLFFFLTAIPLFITSLLIEYFPSDKNLRIRFPSFTELFSPPELPQQNWLKEIEKYHKSLAKDLTQKKISPTDSAVLRHSLDSLLALQKKILFPLNDKTALHHFFEKTKQGKARILHYGDSQIEGERITAQLRHYLQQLFGGGGVGLFPLVSVAPMLSVTTEYDDKWKRATGFGKIDTALQHRLFGPLFSYCFYQSKDSSASFTVKINTTAYSTAKNFNTFIIYYGLPTGKCQITIRQEKTLLMQTLEPTKWSKITAHVNPSAPVTVQFYGTSPYLYALSLEKLPQGIIVDNISLRGSSGTDFTKQNKSFLKLTYDELSPDLIILQFGGNVLPYIENESECIRYGQWFASQIKMLKQLCPSAAFLVIGPSDMAKNINGTMTTYPLLENVRDALKNAALTNGCMFWDMYLNMGGKNSMVKWVGENPPLAGKDYTHFTLSGTKKIADMLWNAIKEEYDLFQHQSKKTKTSIKK